MSVDNKTILFKLELDSKGLIKDSEAAAKNIQNLRAEQTKLLEGKSKEEQSNVKSSVAYQKLDGALKQNTKVLKESSAALLINEQLKGKDDLTTNEQLAQRRALSTAYNNLAQSQLEAAHNFENLTEQEQKNNLEAKKIVDAYGAVNKALGDNGLKVNDGRMKVGQYKDAIIEANKSITGLKKEITLIGYAQAKTNKDFEKGQNDLDAMAQTGDTTSAEYIKLTNQVQELSETLAFQEAAIKGANDELKEQEEALASTEKEARKIGFVYGENIDSLKGYKQAIKEATDEQINAKNQFGELSQEYIDATDKVGKLKNELGDLKEANANATADTGFAKFRNTLGGIGDDLMNLDFEGISEKTQTLQNISSKTTFKGMIGGLKSMGSSFAALGKVILANPLFLLVAVVAAVVGALVYFASQTETAEEANEKLNDSFDRSSKLLDARNKRMNDNARFQVELAKAQGKSIDEINKLEEKAIIKQTKGEIAAGQASAKLIDEKVRLRKIAILTGDEELEKSISKEIFDEKLKLNTIKSNALKGKNDLILLEQNFQNDKKALAQKEIDDNKEKQDQIAQKQKEAYDKYKAQKDAELKLAQEIADRTRGLILGTLELSAENERKIIESQATFKRSAIELEVKDEVQKASDLLQIQTDLNAQLQAVDIKEKENAKARLDDQLKKELSESKGTKAQIASQNEEILKQYQLNIESLDQDFKNKQAEREQSLIPLLENINNAKIESSSKTNEEILKDLESKILEEENNLKRAGKTEIEIEAGTQQAKIDLAKETNRQIQEDNTKSIAEKSIAEQQYQAKLIELNSSANEQKKASDQELADAKKQQNQAIIDASTQLLNDAFSIAQNQITKDLEATKQAYNEKNTALTDQLEQGLITQTQFESKKAILDQRQRNEERTLNKKAFEVNKASQLTNAIIAGAVAINTALATPFIGPALAILAGITTASQIALIASQPTPAFSRGGKAGLFGGKSHSDGGTKGYFDDGTQIEVEKDESFFILNKKATPFLSQLSNLNQSTGGIPLMRNGGALFASGGTAIVGNKISSSIDAQLQLSNILSKAFQSMPSPTVFVSDINKGQSNVNIVENSGNIS